MAITINGSGSITGLSAGGLPDSSITSDDIASGAITQVKLGTGVSGTAPAFSAGKGASPTQTVSNATNTKIQFQTEEFDTASCYDNSTNYRFTPNVAGYYQVNLAIGNGSGGGGYSYAKIYKNGSNVKASLITQTSNGPSNQVSALIYLNGSTDYIEGYWFQASGGNQDVTNGTDISFFQAAMVRAA